MKLTASLSAIIILLAACKSAVITPTNRPDAIGLGSESDSDQMFFFVFQIKADKNKNHVVLVRKTIVQGKIKSSPPPSGNPVNHLLVSLLNKDRRNIQSIQVEHPLFKEAEYVKPDGGFSHKSLNLSEAEFFVRLKYLSDAEWITVEEDVNGEKQITEFNIKR